jgi:hypothetical protein
MKNNRMKQMGILAVLAVAVAAATWMATRRQAAIGEGPELEQPAAIPGQGAISVSDAAIGTGAVVAVRHGLVTTGGDAGAAATNTETKARNLRPYSEDQKKVFAMEALVDEGDERGAIEIARQLIKSEDADVRADVVDTLGWIGVKALPDLTVLLADNDPDVADEAQRKWLESLEEVDDPQARADLLKGAMSLARDEDNFQELTIAAASLPDAIAVRLYVDLIEGTQGNSVVNPLALQEYEGITGKPYATRAEAEKWIANHPEPVIIER